MGGPFVGVAWAAFLIFVPGFWTNSFVKPGLQLPFRFFFKTRQGLQYPPKSCGCVRPNEFRLKYRQNDSGTRRLGGIYFLIFFTPNFCGVFLWEKFSTLLCHVQHAIGIFLYLKCARHPDNICGEALRFLGFFVSLETFKFEYAYFFPVTQHTHFFGLFTWFSECLIFFWKVDLGGQASLQVGK